MSTYPQIVHAQVWSVDPEAGLIYVQTSSLAIPMPVKPLHHGQADGVRVRQAPLPLPSTWGICIFPYGDARNGVWLGGYYSTLMDARTAGDPNADYTAWFDGGWELVDSQGQHTRVYSDGSYVQVAGSTALPSPTRHIVNSKQVQEKVPFTQAQRVPNPPSPRYMYIKHASGTTLEIDPSGNVIINGAT